MRSTSPRRAVMITLALSVALTACASDDTDGTDPTDPAIETEEPADEPDESSDPEPDAEADAEPDADAAGDVVATDTVQVRNINFEPADIEVEVGTTVTWVNEDIVNHTVTSGPAGEPDGIFDVELPSNGDDATVTFDEAGTFVYYCDLHRNMVGSVTVTS